MKSQPISWAIINLLVFWFVLGLCSEDDVRKLLIRTTYRPQECEAYAARRAVIGDHLRVHFIGLVASTNMEGTPGELFDTTRASDTPYQFQLGSTGVLKGWDEAVANMCVGEKRVVTFPAGYGWHNTNQMSGGMISGRGKLIPKGADLEFEIELVSFVDPPTHHSNLFGEMDANRDGVVNHDEMSTWFKQRHPRQRGTIPSGLWERQDLNKDGVVTWKEFRGPKGDQPPVRGDL